MKKFLFILVFATKILSAQTADSLTFSEIMFYQPETNCEFVEIYNFSRATPVNIAGLKLQYSTSPVDSVETVYGSPVLLPRHFAIIFEGDYDFANPFYSVPDSVTVLRLTDSNFGSLGMSNTSDKVLILFSANNDTLSVYRYSADNSQGFSDEKIILSGDNGASNWANSQTENGTPGIRNTVTPFDFDLRVKSFYAANNLITVADSFRLDVVVQNSGLQPNDYGALQFYLDANRDSVFDDFELLDENEIPRMNYLDTALIGKKFFLPDTGNFLFLATAVLDADENPENDSALLSVRILPKLAEFGEICINEIKYKPLAGEPEWVEIFNNSDEYYFNLKNWRIADNVSSKEITPDDFFIQPREFVILSADDTILDFYPINSRVIYITLPSLNNSGDKLKLINNFGEIIDSVEYSELWNNAGENSSLEKINSNLLGNDSANWRGCENPLTGTPGEINSVSPKDYDVKIDSFFSFPQNALLNENIELSAEIVNSGEYDADFDLLLYYDENRDSVAETLISEIDCFLPGKDSAIFAFPVNLELDDVKFFVVKARFDPDQDTSNNSSQIRIFPSFEKNSILINEVLFQPQSGECEWIELVNNSSYTLNLINCTINDLFTTPHSSVISGTDYYLPPNEKLILAKDSTIFDFHDFTTNRFIIPASFPNLNNTEEGVIIQDANSETLDSLHYFGRWIGANNCSLERILRQNPTNDSLNWAKSQDSEFSTPWRKNSATPFQFDLAIDKITIDRAAVSSSGIPLTIQIKNPGQLPSNSSVMELYNDMNGDSLITGDELFAEIDVDAIPPFDSAVVFYQLENPDLFLNLIAYLHFPNDETDENNYGYQRILPFYSEGKIKINEIHYAPINGEPEWIEFQNCAASEINLEKMLIQDKFTTPSETKLTDTMLMIAPNEKFVLAKDSAVYDYHAQIPSLVIINKFPNLNNDKEGVFLKNSYGFIIDSVLFTSDWGGANGCSLERISIYNASQDSLNWASSNDEELSTPGRKNSVSLKIHDIRADTAFFEPLFPARDENIKITAQITNIGTETENAFYVLFYENNIKTDSIIVNDLLPNETRDIEYFTRNAVNDSLKIAINVALPNDEELRNNLFEFVVYSGLDYGNLIISEIMATPDSSGEWIEIFNATDKIVSGNEFILCDSALRYSSLSALDEQTLIPPFSYFVLCSDSTKFDNYGYNCNRRTEYNFGSLNNERDIIYIFDFRGNLIDSLFYYSWAFKTGFSFEKIDLDEANIPQNWGVSIDSLKATPGAENSIIDLPNYQNGDVVINEIMYEPAENNSEFFEIYNLSDFPVQIGGWYFTDLSGAKHSVSDFKFELPSHEYFVVAADSSVLSNYPLEDSERNIQICNSSFNLGNIEDAIILKDIHGNTIDSVYYFAEWHNSSILNTNNRSLERINPDYSSNNAENWSSSLAKLKATPCSQNTIFQSEKQNGEELSVEPNPFSPDNDGFEDVAFIKYSLSSNINFIRIRIYDSKGRLVRTLLDNYPASSSGEIIFNGENDEGNKLGMGIYIILFEASENNKIVKQIIKPVVIARKLN